MMRAAAVTRMQIRRVYHRTMYIASCLCCRLVVDACMGPIKVSE